MRTWTINSITIIEQAHDHDLHSFAVYHGGDYLGTIYPDSVDDMRQCIAALDNGAEYRRTRQRRRPYRGRLGGRQRQRLHP